MTVSKKRAVIYDGGLGGTGQSFCSFMRLKCTEKVQCSLHEWSQSTRDQQELKKTFPK